MKILRPLSLVAGLLLAGSALAADGLVSLKSPHGTKATMDKLEDNIRLRGLSVFARMDHANGAAQVGKTLRPTELIIFGSPKGGTPFMECAQTVGIDLPLKALVWQDAAGQVWLSYNDPAYIAQRHGASQCAVVDTLRKAVVGIAEASVTP